MFSSLCLPPVLSLFFLFLFSIFYRTVKYPKGVRFPSYMELSSATTRIEFPNERNCGELGNET